MNQTLPRIALTMGDPSGIGPEIIAKAVTDPEMKDLAHWVVVGDADVLARASAVTGCSLPPEQIHSATTGFDGFEFGRMEGRYGSAAVEYVRVGTEMCRAGEAQAMVTAPLNKEAVTLSGRPFTGHTEYIAGLCNATESRMLLACEKLCTVHVTTHMSLRKACDSTKERIVRTIQLGDEAMKLMGFTNPRIAVCGLNPHAGEHGLFGTEDGANILPAIEEAKAMGINCSGPHAGDTVFLQGYRGAYDLIVAQYHDQGHIPMKLIDFEGTVNISIGIPIIRTSVDHGTAFDIAGKNKADPRSMKQAMKMAVRMARTKMGMAA